MGLIALLQNDRDASQAAFLAAIKHADMMIERCDQNFEAFDAKGRALAGLAVIDGPEHVSDAVEALRAARVITKATGIVGRVRRLLHVLAPADLAGVLAPVYAAAEGLGQATGPRR